MEGIVAVSVASEWPVYLSVDLLCARSKYFSTALQGGFCEGKKRAVNVPWQGNPQNCVLFLTWLGSMNNSGKDFTSDCMLLFLRCCAYFQVTEEYWVLVLQGIRIPNTFDNLTPTTREIWNRQVLPFQILEKLVVKVLNKLERLKFILAWFNEKTATSPSEKQDLETCGDFFLMRKLATTTLTFSQRIPTFGVSGAPIYHDGSSVTVASLIATLTQFPLAANCLESTWLLKLVQEINAGNY